MFHSVGITTKRDVEDKELLREIIRYLLKKKKKVFLSMHARDNLDGDFSELPTIDYNKKFDLMIAFGGDGTILRAARNLKYLSTAVLGVNAGHLGFLSTMGMQHWQDKLDKVFAGKCEKMPRALCRIKHERNGEVLLDTKVLNDAVISFKNVARLIQVDTKIEKRNLCTYSADGLIISTPTGSTAYSLAAGGPIVYPTLDALILTPICSHSFTQKPIVLPGNKKITLEFTHNDELLNLTLDGQRSFDVYREDKVKVELMKKHIIFIRLPGQHFVKTLRKKLHWGEHLR